MEDRELGYLSLKAEERPPSLLDLEQRLEERLPFVDLKVNWLIKWIVGPL